MIGQKLSHYRIEEQIGAGGMGVVYRARDERLDRDVALKVLPAGTVADDAARKRFRKEALTLSQLNHPNIATVHDFDTQDGIDFLVMEHVAGVRLAQKLAAGPLPEKEVAALGIQIAEALEEAHARGIVHRDLKPGNIMVTPAGRAKVLDFGLAKLIGSTGVSPVDLGGFGPNRHGQDARATAGPTEDLLTTPGMAVGTVAYMSPEQLRGETIDARTDIYALGGVLYEMATGRRAFQQETAIRLSDAILHQAPVSPRALNGRISPELERIILKCLDKHPESRFQSAKELQVDLRRLALVSTASSVPAAAPAGFPWRGVILVSIAIMVVAGVTWLTVRPQRRPAETGPPRIESLAVLPLDNLSHDPGQDYFADGMTEELITDLAKIAALRVISRTSAMRYKGSQKPVSQIAQELNVDAIIEGSVLRSGERVRITAQLIQAATDRHLWAESYEGDLRDVLAVQSQVARAIANEIRVKLTPGEQARLATARPVNPEAHEAYLRGLYEIREHTTEGAEKAIEYFRQALAHDPNDALAYAGLAIAYYDQSTFQKAPLDVMPKAKAAAARALELDNTLAEAHASLGYVKLVFDWDWPGAEGEFRRALELNPSLPGAHAGYARYLMTLRRTEECLQELQRAKALDPLFQQSHGGLPMYLLYARRYEEAIEAARKVADDAHLALSYAELGRRDEAVAAADRAIESTRQPVALTFVAAAYELAGKKNKARAVLDGVEQQARRRYVCGFSVACVYAVLGDKEQAFAWLEKAYRDRAD